MQAISTVTGGILNIDDPFLSEPAMLIGDNAGLLRRRRRWADSAPLANRDLPGECLRRSCLVGQLPQRLDEASNPCSALRILGQIAALGKVALCLERLTPQRTVCSRREQHLLKDGASHCQRSAPRIVMRRIDDLLSGDDGLLAGIGPHRQRCIAVHAMPPNDNPLMTQGKRISKDIGDDALLTIRALGAAAKAARLAAGEGQTAAATRLGVHVQTIGRIEAGEPGVSIVHMVGLLALYDVTVTPRPQQGH